MSRPATRPGNANKHPGDIVRNANRQQRPKEEIAAEKKRKLDEKVAKSSAAEQARIKTARQEDAMAIEQQVQLAGPPKLIRPRPRPRIPAKKSMEPQADLGESDAQSTAQTKSAATQRHAPVTTHI
ncbi:uncharacterized protein F5891DRAFT_1198274 [Suillus fuscotomentosus]|uniref:Uncharacterized protein n=1 Tax=Suillus fuscotomentosus TaxID=1912939 RepID=A0AAD4HDG1_9AGAM|nr:uncharacterized protein F5891DRAFT_1198274 [Suillus fuscotomentosus]KAG1889821.1 hypothetical protein F5891DRAFT_1198274 [Suillus fuscotomentosus]